MAMDREKEMEGSGERGKISREMGRDGQRYVRTSM